MERIDIVIVVCHSFDFSVFTAVHTGETSRKSFGRSSQNGVVQVIFLFVFISHLVDFQHGFIKGVPCLLAVSVSLSIESHHGIVSAQEADTQRTTAQHVAYLFVRVQGSSSFPYIISHHEGELACQGCTLILISLVELFGYQGSRFMYRFDENFFSLSLDGIFIVSVLRHVFCFDTGFDGQARHVQRGERKVSASQRRFLAGYILKHTRAASHGGQFVTVTLRVVGVPFFVLVERGIQEHKVREECFCRSVASFQEQVEVGCFKF